MARVQPNGTQIAPNCSKPGLEKWKWDVRHATWCTVNIWSKLMKGQRLPRGLFLDVHRGETVPSLALKRNFLLQTTAQWPVCFPAPTYHVLSSNPITTVQVHSGAGFFSCYNGKWLDRLSLFCVWQETQFVKHLNKMLTKACWSRIQRGRRVRSVQDSCDDKCKRGETPPSNSLSLIPWKFSF